MQASRLVNCEWDIWNILWTFFVKYLFLTFMLSGPNLCNKICHFYLHFLGFLDFFLLLEAKSGFAVFLNCWGWAILCCKIIIETSDGVTLVSINFINNIGEASTIDLVYPPSSPNFASKSRGGAVSDQCHMTMPGVGRVTVLCPANDPDQDVQDPALPCSSLTLPE